MKDLFERFKIYNHLLVIVGFIGFAALSNCGKKTTGDPIPTVQVDKYINISLPGYSQLQNLGGYVTESGGVKGLFVIKNYSGTYQCFDLCCSFQPLDSCAKLTVDSSGVFLKCGTYASGVWQPCCGSQFGIDGVAQKAPASRPLRQYQVSFDGNYLHIFN
jgi:Rieske Fe-S protein